MTSDLAHLYADKWLESKGVVLWADWDLSQADRRALAAEWFVEQSRSFVAFVESVTVDDDQPGFGLTKDTHTVDTHECQVCGPPAWRGDSHALWCAPVTRWLEAENQHHCTPDETETT